VRLEDIATRAGVSRMTVSRVLRNTPGVAAATREAVWRVAREMGYRPNPLVSALMAGLRAPRKATRAIAYLTTRRSDSGWMRHSSQALMFAGAQARAAELGWHLAPVWTGQAEPGRLHRILQAQGVEGILVGGMPRNWNHLRLEWEHYAVAALGYSLTRPVFHRVATHHLQSVQMAMRTLRRRGYRRIGLALSRQEDHRLGRQMAGGFLGCGIRWRREEALAPYFPDGRVEEEGFFRWLETERPDALLLGQSMRVALPWLERLPQRPGIVILGPIGDGMDYAHIERDFPTLGAGAIDLIVAQLHRNERGIPARPQTLLLDTLWVEGASVRRGRVQAPAT